MRLRRHAFFAGAVFNFSTVISASTFINGFNLRSAAISAGWDQVLPLIATVNINSGVTISHDSSDVFTAQGAYPLGSRLSLFNNGSIVGRGGAGGRGSYGGAGGPGDPGAPGGNAIVLTIPTTINNAGVIAGGGGGGGGGGDGYSGAYGPGGGGGGGARVGSGGAAGSGSGAAAGSNGGTETGGNGGAGGPGAGFGGKGGNLGQPGAKGFAGSGTGPGAVGGQGGPAGYAIDGIAYVTLNNSGTILGPTI